MEVPVGFTPISLDDEEFYKSDGVELNEEPERLSVQLSNFHEDGSEKDRWLTEYKKLIQRSFGEVLSLLINTQWSLIVGPLGSGERIHLFRDAQETTDSMSHYNFKIEGTIDARPERLAYIMNDFSKNRMKWDQSFIDRVEKIEEFAPEGMGTFTVSETEWKMPIKKANPRHALGVSWKFYDASNQCYKLVFRTCLHRSTRSPRDSNTTVPMICLTGFFIRFVGRTKSQITGCLHFNLGNGIPAKVIYAHAELIRKRFHLYEKVAQNWDQYYKK